jgi:hypothetical protein
MPSKRRQLEGAEGWAPQDPRDMAKAGLLEAQFPVAIGTPFDTAPLQRDHRDTPGRNRPVNALLDGR